MTVNQVTRLLRVYDAERLTYERILDTVNAERKALLDKRPLSEIIVLLKIKQELMREIDLLDRSIAREKDLLKTCGSRISDRDSLLLNEMIGELKTIVGRILALEDENENIVLGYDDSTEATQLATLKETP